MILKHNWSKNIMNGNEGMIRAYNFCIAHNIDKKTSFEIAIKLMQKETENVRGIKDITLMLEDIETIKNL